MPAKHIVLQPLAPQDLAIKWWGFLDPQSWPNRPSSHCMLWFPQLQHMKTVPASIGLNFHWLFQGAKNQITPKAERWHVFLFNVLRECHDVFESEFLNSLWFRTHRLLMDPHRPSNQHSGEGTHAKDQEFIYMRQFTVRPKKIATRALHFPLGYLIQSQVFQFDVPHVMHWQLISTYLPSSAVSLWNEFQSWFCSQAAPPTAEKNPPWNLAK